MPRTQVAHVPTYRLGPGNPSAVWQVKRGCKLQIRFEAEDDAAAITLQVSADNSSWAATTANDQGQAVTGVAIVAGGHTDVSLNMRHQKDNYLRAIVTGGIVTAEIRGEEKLEIVVA